MIDFKKLSVILVMILSTVLLYGCGGNTPKAVVNDYFQKVQKGDTDIQKLFAVVEGTEEGTKDELENNNFSDETQEKLLGKLKEITYKINSETIDGDNAKVNVTVKGMDFNIILGKVMQEAFSFIFTQTLSGVEMTEEENNAYFNTLLNKYLDEITYSERTLDIELTKIDKEWKIKESNAISKLLLGIDESAFNNENVGDNKDEVTSVKEMTLNTPFTVETENGNYNLTIEGARATDERNEFSGKEVKHVVFLDYSYENISFGQNSGNDLYIDEYAFQVLDDEGNVVDTYPVYDENRTPKDTPVGGKCKASGTFGVTTESKNLNVTFKRGNEKVAKIAVPIN